MRPDEFEKHLQRQPLREIPTEWRAEILRRAKSTPRRSPFSSFISHISSILWPRPRAWAGLAAIWVVLIVVHFGSGESAGNVEKKAETPSPQTLMALREQEQMLAELIGQSPSVEVDRPKRILQSPRSERRRVELLA